MLLKKVAYLSASMLLASAAMGATAQAQTTLTLINEYPATSITATADLNFAEQVEELSEGSLLIETLQEGDNPFKGVDQVDAITNGEAQMGTLFGGILGARDSLFLLSSLPFAARDFAEARAIYTCAKPALEERAQQLNARLLYVTPWPPSGIWSVESLESAADLEQLKIRTYDETSKSVFERLGAESVHLPYSDLSEKLAAGEVNAVLTSGDGGAGRNLWDHLPHFTAVSYSIPLSYTIINLDAWNSLDGNQQAILLQAAEQVSEASWSGVEQRIDANYARMRDNGMTLNTDPSTSVMDALPQGGSDETDVWLEENQPSETEAACLS